MSESPLFAVCVFLVFAEVLQMLIIATATFCDRKKNTVFFGGIQVVEGANYGKTPMQYF